MRLYPIFNNKHDSRLIKLITILTIICIFSLSIIVSFLVYDRREKQKIIYQQRKLLEWRYFQIDSVQLVNNLELQNNSEKNLLNQMGLYIKMKEIAHQRDSFYLVNNYMSKAIYNYQQIVSLKDKQIKKYKKIAHNDPILKNKNVNRLTNHLKKNNKMHTHQK
ncbi:MAG: hypothetical protein QM528_05865 [Phycisphaerales bacterium]|nr:hypothetical protein [Phycisphaerales bacterium]